MSKNTIPNIWTAQEKVLHLYKLISVAACIFATAMGIALIVSQFKNPIVVVAKNQEVEFYPTARIAVPLEKAEIEQFTKQFLASLYVWSEFNGDRIAKSISPFTEGTLSEKVIGTQSQKYLKELGGKKLSQSLAFVEVSMLPDRVICKFDRILKIEGIPLVIPTEVTLALVQGDQTVFNPMGIYVGGIKESENGK
jgi:hypothetical protein